MARVMVKLAPVTVTALRGRAKNCIELMRMGGSISVDVRDDCAMISGESKENVRWAAEDLARMDDAMREGKCAVDLGKLPARRLKWLRV